MKAIVRPLARAGLTVAAFASFGFAQSAYAVGTAANTTISNTATVNYTVGGVGQTPIESSPAGNTTPGTGNGAATTFVVDNRIDFTVTELSGGNTVVNPGQAGAVTAFRVTNTGNAPQGFALAAANETGTTVFTNTDNVDVTGLTVFVDSLTDGTIGVYDPGIDTAANINTLAADDDVVVFVVANVPVTTVNGDFANVSLTARAAVPGTNGATIAAETVGADDPNAVDIVFGDDGEDNSEADSDQYAVQSAALSVQKTSAVASDPFNGTDEPKAIPGATVEYTITLANGGAVSAAGVTIGDTLPANTTFVANAYNSGASNVSITVGAGSPTYCNAEAGGTDTNGDGCVINAGQLVVGSPALGTVATGAGNQVAVRFRVTIN
jgi:uncharacterized repeat protein (TIGR01451 family)